MPLFEELQRQRALMLNEDMSRVRVTGDDIYKWIEDAIVADGNSQEEASQMMEFGLNQEIITDDKGKKRPDNIPLTLPRKQ